MNVVITDEEVTKFVTMLLMNKIRIDPRKSMRQLLLEVVHSPDIKISARVEPRRSQADIRGGAGSGNCTPKRPKSACHSAGNYAARIRKRCGSSKALIGYISFFKMYRAISQPSVSAEMGINAVV